MMSDKQTTLNLLNSEYQAFHQTIDGLNNEQMTRVWFGAWGVKDIVAHVLGWESEMTEALRRLARGERPTPEGVDYSDSDAWNAKFAERWRGVDANTVVAAWEQAHATYVRAAQAVAGDRFGEKDGKPATANRLIETSGCGHFREHGPQIAAWRKQEGI